MYNNVKFEVLILVYSVISHNFCISAVKTLYFQLPLRIVLFVLFIRRTFDLETTSISIREQWYSKITRANSYVIY